MADEMTLYTKIMHSLMDLGPGEVIEAGNIAVTKNNADNSFQVWDDGESYWKADVNDAAEFIEDNFKGDAWPDVERRPQTQQYEVVINQSAGTPEPIPNDEQVTAAVRSGLAQFFGFRSIESVTVKLTYN